MRYLERSLSQKKRSTPMTSSTTLSSLSLHISDCVVACSSLTQSQKQQAVRYCVESCVINTYDSSLHQEQIERGKVVKIPYYIALEATFSMRIVLLLNGYEAT